jgi:hypothetical protein
MNMLQKMKNLEGKYIELANYYKQELLSASPCQKGLDHNEDRIINELKIEKLKFDQ